jgi:hypothetical protein
LRLLRLVAGARGKDRSRNTDDQGVAQDERLTGAARDFRDDEAARRSGQGESSASVVAATEIGRRHGRVEIGGGDDLVRGQKAQDTAFNASRPR